VTMDYIEYIQIFISLVLGLAFAKIITSYAVIIRNASRVKFYWPYFPLSIGLLIFVINDFWTGFERSNFLTIGSGLDMKISFVTALITPLSYTMVAELLYPKANEDKIFDLRDILEARKTAYILGAFNSSYTFVSALLYGQVSVATSAQLIRLSILTIFIIGIFNKNELVQKWISVLFFLMAIAWFSFENTI
jgi:hypothetical protein